jgi:hypothetical protein
MGETYGDVTRDADFTLQGAPLMAAPNGVLDKAIKFITPTN